MPDPLTNWESTVDRAMRACTSAFGEGRDQQGDGRVMYYPSGSDPYRVDGIYEAATESVDLDTGAMVMSNQPRISFALSELRALPNIGDRVHIRDQSYIVAEPPEFDGQGTVSLRLHVAQSTSGGSD